LSHFYNSGTSHSTFFDEKNIMKALPQILILCIAAISVMSWAYAEKQPLDIASWMLGTWENKTERGSIYESWSRTGVNALSGKSYKLNQHDTVAFEMISLVREHDKLIYIPQVSDQNDGQPVRFASTKITPDVLIFENPEHDFPQVISYTRVTTDSLVASISGMRNGEERKILFPMRRVK